MLLLFPPSFFLSSPLLPLSHLFFLFFVILSFPSLLLPFPHFQKFLINSHFPPNFRCFHSFLSHFAHFCLSSSWYFSLSFSLFVFLSFVFRFVPFFSSAFLSSFLYVKSLFPSFLSPPHFFPVLFHLLCLFPPLSLSFSICALFYLFFPNSLSPPISVFLAVFPPLYFSPFIFLPFCLLNVFFFFLSFSFLSPF